MFRPDYFYWLSPESHIHKWFNLALSHVVTTEVMLTIIKIIQIGLLLQYSCGIIKIQLRKI